MIGFKQIEFFDHTRKLKVVHTEYEHVNIDERFKSGVGTGIVVVFKDPACQKQ